MDSDEDPVFPQLLETARLACAPERLCLSAASGDTVTALELVKQLKVRASIITLSILIF